MKIIDYGRIYLAEDGNPVFDGFFTNCEGARYETLSSDIEDVDYDDPRFQRDLMCEIIRLHLTGARLIELHGRMSA
jgi:hypothetical protein